MVACDITAVGGVGCYGRGNCMSVGVAEGHPYTHDDASCPNHVILDCICCPTTTPPTTDMSYYHTTANHTTYMPVCLCISRRRTSLYTLDCLCCPTTTPTTQQTCHTTTPPPTTQHTCMSICVAAEGHAASSIWWLYLLWIFMVWVI